MENPSGLVVNNDHYLTYWQLTTEASLHFVSFMLNLISVIEPSPLISVYSSLWVQTSMVTRRISSEYLATHLTRLSQDR